MNKDATISFTFPYEWLSTDEGKKYFKKNVEAQIHKYSVIKPMEHPRLARGLPSAYSVVIEQHGYKPKRFGIKRDKIEETFKDIYPGARLVQFETFFVQNMKPKVFCRMLVYF